MTESVLDENSFLILLGIAAILGTVLAIILALLDFDDDRYIADRWAELARRDAERSEQRAHAERLRQRVLKGRY